jgi:hypothetical protein
VDNCNVTVSCEADEVFFVGRRDTPTEAHLYRLPVRGLLGWVHGDPDIEEVHPGAPHCITELGMYHEVVVSGDGRVIIDTRSSVSAPPVCSVAFPDHAAPIELFRHPEVPECVTT